MQIRVQITQKQRGASRNVWLARTLDPPKLRPAAFVASSVFHLFLLVMLARGAAPSRETEAVYEVSLQPPAEMTATIVAPATEAAAESAKLQAADAPYWIKIRHRIARHLQYPDSIMKETGHAIVVVLQLEISPRGALLNADVVTPGVNPVVVRLVLDAVHASEPFPAPTSREQSSVPLTVLLPIRFVASAAESA